MKLIGKLTLALMLATSVVLAAYGYLSVRRERALFKADVQRDGRLLGRALSEAVADAIRGKARRIGAGDLGGPLLLDRDDELDELALEMNAMCSRLAEATPGLGTRASCRTASSGRSRSPCTSSSRSTTSRRKCAITRPRT